MILQEQTARAWMKAFAIWTLLYGILFVPMGFLYAFIGPFGEAGIAAVIIGFLYVVFGLLALLVGAGIWSYRPWARTAMVALGWLSAASGLLLAIAGATMGTLLGSVPELAVLGPRIGLLVLIAGLLTLLAAALHLWLFQFEPTVRSLFTGRGRLMPALDATNVREVTQGWAALSGLSAVSLAIVAVLFAIIGIAFAHNSPGTIVLTVMLAAGLLLLVFAALFGLLARGLWQLREWARIVSIVLAYLLGLIGVAYVLLMPIVSFAGEVAALDVATGVLSGLYYLVLSAVQVWFFQFNEDVRRLFSPPAQTTGQRRAAVKRKRPSR